MAVESLYSEPLKLQFESSCCYFQAFFKKKGGENQLGDIPSFDKFLFSGTFYVLDKNRTEPKLK